MLLLTQEALDPRAVEAAVAHDGAGGLCTFQGAVRDHNEGRSVAHLEYEAYPEMASAAMEQIAAEAERRWPGARVALAHRLGRLEIGEVSVVVAASAAHRAEAFEACRFCIDALKATVPIWKKEVWAEGSAWIEGTPPAPLGAEGGGDDAA
jgi:molybdopterin synthase catalytic subunit